MYGSTLRTVHVNVTVPPLPRSKNWPAETGQENDTVMLQCQINQPANPAPSYTWRRLPEGGAPPVVVRSQGRFQLTSDHQLQISSVRKEDEGLYECIVENSLGQSKQVVQLQLASSTPTPGMSFSSFSYSLLVCSIALAQTCELWLERDPSLHVSRFYKYTHTKPIFRAIASDDQAMSSSTTGMKTKQAVLSYFLLLQSLILQRMPTLLECAVWFPT